MAKKRIIKKGKLQYTPLKGSFLATSIIGFLFSAILLPKYSITWAFTFAIVFVLMFIASMISMNRAEPEL
ncbi:hypothetical protein COV18_01365 [Candidatus Woesearchaeota archaeon CG10_big_fil_rev_8_21_14_0_10_37_12]|nr:MAG: hypothetical protein COV18_01365 [Candidatus Woesearchaeota archaeon CG10_big_fil_rev_8_21_14_0_10_37_12]